jgi:hypothetical protein
MDDYSPCSCVFASRQHQQEPARTDKERLKRAIAAGGMRAMVTRKLRSKVLA